MIPLNKPLPPLAAVLVAALACGGCSAYHGMPLDSQAVEAALKEPDPGVVRVEAAAIRHPLVAPITIDGRGGYTPDEVAVMAVLLSPALRALRDQRGVAEAQVIQAGILPNPTFSYEIDRPDAYPLPVSTQVTQGLTWDISRLLSHRSQAAAAEAGAKSLDLSIAWQEWQAAQDARMRAFRILAIGDSLAPLRGVEQELSAAMDDMRRALAQGYQTLGDLNGLADALGAARDARIDAENQLRDEQASLSLSLSFRPGTIVPLKAPSRLPEFPGDPVMQAGRLLDGLEDRRLDLVALKLGYKSQEEGLRAAVLQQFPRIGIGFVHSRDNSVPQVVSNGPSLSIDLPLFDRNQGQVRIAKATRQQLRDEYIARIAEARSDVARVLDDIAAARARLGAADDAIPDLEAMVTAMTRALPSRSMDARSYREACASLAARRVEQGRLRQQLLELEVALEIATGRPLLDRESPPSP